MIYATKVSKLETYTKYTLITGISFVLFFPILYMLCNSFMPIEQIMQMVTGGGGTEAFRSFELIPQPVTFMQYYKVMLRTPEYLHMFWNSVRMTVPIVLGQLFIACLGGYAFAKLRFPLRDPLFFAFIVVMLMPYQVTLVPNYIMLRKLSLIGSYMAVILPGAFATFGVFLMRQFARSVPDEYCESARIDGAGFFRTFTSIVMPQCKGGVASITILVFIDNWNMVEQPLIFLKDQFKHPLSVFMNYINSSMYGLAFASGVLYMLPAILIFLYGEEELVSGIQLSGIK